MLQIVFGIVALLSLALCLVYRKKLGQDQFFGPLLPGVVVTAVAILLFLASYLWLFDQPRSCASRGDFPCMINANQGFLTLLGLVIAVVAVWTSIATTAAGRKREDKEAAARTAALVQDAIDELCHNLQHVAGAYRGDRLCVVPQVSVDATSALLDSENRLRLSSAVIRAIEPLRRNAERLKEARSASKPPAGRAAAKADPEPIGGFVRCTIDVFVYLWRHHHEWSCKPLQRPGLQDLPRFAPERSLVSFRSSGAQGDAAWLRTEEAPLVCWIDDEPIPGVKTYVVGQRFIDAEEAHSDH